MLENLDTTGTAAMRLFGLVAPERQDGIVIQALTIDGTGEVRIDIFTVGLGRPAGLADSWELLDSEALADIVEDGKTHARTLPGGRTVVLHTDGLEERWPDLEPHEALVADLVTTRAGRDALFFPAGDLADRLDLPDPLGLLVEFDEWDQPSCLAPVDSSMDLQLAVEALRARRRIDTPVSGVTWDALLRQRIATMSDG